MGVFKAEEASRQSAEKRQKQGPALALPKKACKKISFVLSRREEARHGVECFLPPKSVSPNDASVGLVCNCSRNRPRGEKKDLWPLGWAAGLAHCSRLCLVVASCAGVCIHRIHCPSHGLLGGWSLRALRRLGLCALDAPLFLAASSSLASSCEARLLVHGLALH